jgi:hypothetical protein
MADRIELIGDDSGAFEVILISPSLCESVEITKNLCIVVLNGSRIAKKNYVIHTPECNSQLLNISNNYICHCSL